MRLPGYRARGEAAIGAHQPEDEVHPEPDNHEHGDGAAEGGETEAVDADMTPIGMEPGISEKAPDRRRLAARQESGKQARIGDPRRDEGEQQQDLVVDLIAE